MIKQIEELKQQLNEAKAVGGDWNTPYQELMKAVYNNSVLFFALSKNEFNPETFKSVPLISRQGEKGKKAVAKMLGVSINTVRKYWDGDNVPWERKL